MRQLILFRHGHSEENINDDINRHLTSHGEKEVKHTAKELHKMEFNPERIFSSPATRTMKTAELVEHVFALPKLHVEIQPTLYHATAADLLTFIETWDEKLSAVVLVGHNPALSESARLLAKQPLADLKAGECYWLQWPQKDSWEDIANGIVAADIKVLKVE